MCKHILNAQVSIRSPCCKKWFDCEECHEEQEDHKLQKTTVLVLACKKCKKVFRKDMGNFDETDEYCPHCDNHYYIDAKTSDRQERMVLKTGDADLIPDSRVQSKTGSKKEDDENETLRKAIMSNLRI